jgi:hypothetical protein
MPAYKPLAQKWKPPVEWEPMVERAIDQMYRDAKKHRIPTFIMKQFPRKVFRRFVHSVLRVFVPILD